MFFSPKIVFPVVIGLAGASALTATALIKNTFSSPKKCWYDDEKDGDFLEKVEKIIKENPDDQKNFPNGKKISDLKDLITSFCTMNSESSLAEFEKKFGSEDYPDLFDLLVKEVFKFKKIDIPENMDETISEA